MLTKALTYFSLIGWSRMGQFHVYMAYISIHINYCYIKKYQEKIIFFFSCFLQKISKPLKAEPILNETKSWVFHPQGVSINLYFLNAKPLKNIYMSYTTLIVMRILIKNIPMWSETNKIKKCLCESYGVQMSGCSQLMSATKRRKGQMLTLTDEGGRGVWQMLILADKGRRADLE